MKREIENAKIKQRAKNMLKIKRLISPKTIWVKMAILTCLLTNGYEAKALTKDPLNTKENTILTSSPTDSDLISDENIESFFQNDEVKEKIINYIVDKKTSELQNQIINNIAGCV